MIINHSFDPSKISYLVEDEIKNDFTFNINNSKVVINKWSANEIYFTTKTSTEQFLIMSEIYFPYGWELTDGIKQYNIYEVNNLVRGFFVPEGEKNFILKFKPKDIFWGKSISLISLLFIIIIMFYSYRRKIYV